MQQASLPNWQTIKQLRLAAKEGLLSREEFHVLLCPQVFIQIVPDEGDLPPGVVRNTPAVGAPVDPDIKIVGFHPEKEET